MEIDKELEEKHRADWIKAEYEVADWYPPAKKKNQLLGWYPQPKEEVNHGT